jgi:hypothetical protein
MVNIGTFQSYVLDINIASEITFLLVLIAQIWSFYTLKLLLQSQNKRVNKINRWGIKQMKNKIIEYYSFICWKQESSRRRDYSKAHLEERGHMALYFRTTFLFIYRGCFHKI